MAQRSVALLLSWRRGVQIRLDLSHALNSPCKLVLLPATFLTAGLDILFCNSCVECESSLSNLVIAGCDLSRLGCLVRTHGKNLTYCAIRFFSDLSKHPLFKEITLSFTCVIQLSKITFY